jgi:integrase
MADRKLFTDKFIETLKPAPAGTRYMRWDSKIDHLAVRVTDTGRKTFLVVKRKPDRKLKYETLGTYGDITLAKAREKAQQALDLLADGKSLRAELRARDDAVAAETAKAAAADASAFARVAAEYKTRYIERKQKARTQEETWRPFRKLFIPLWGARHVASITRRDIKSALNGLVDEGKGVTANRAKTVLSGFYTWAIDEGYVETSPVAGMKDLVDEEARDRVLADLELQLIWSAAGKMAYPYGDMVKMLAITAQRRDEVAQIARPELLAINDPERARWLLPASRTKAGREHMVPLSAPARAIIEAAPKPDQDQPDGEFLFSTTNGVRPISGYSKCKAELDELIAADLAQQNAGNAASGLEQRVIERWTLHDLRRTAATGMERLGIPDAVRKAVLNHSRATDLGVTAVYSRHDYAREKREALDRWAVHLLGIVEPPAADNVASIAAARARRGGATP